MDFANILRSAIFKHSFTFTDIRHQRRKCRKFKRGEGRDLPILEVLEYSLGCFPG